MNTQDYQNKFEKGESSLVEKLNCSGSLVYTGHLKGEVGRVEVIRFSEQSFLSLTLNDLSEISSSPFAEESIWVRVIGLNDLDRIKHIGEQFQLDELVLEDILNVQQRPSLHHEQEFVYAISKLLMFNKKTKKVKFHQASLVLKNSVLISFEETEEVCISNVLNRLQNNVGKIRKRVRLPFLLTFGWYH